MDKKYIGVALHPSLNDIGRESGEISVTELYFVFFNQSFTKEIPLSGIQIDIVKTGVTRYYFTHPQEPEWRFYTSEKSILNEKSLKAFPELQKIQQKFFKQRKNRVYRNMRLLLVSFFAIFLFIRTTAFTTDLLVRNIVNKIPVEMEMVLGDLAFKNYTLSSKLINDGEAVEMVNELLKPILSVIEPKRYAFKFHIANSPEINAAAFPGGNIIINAGLIEFSQSPEEIIGVLSHEIAHVQNRHSLQQSVKALGFSAMIQFVLGDISTLNDVFLRSGNFLLTQRFSRKFEEDADFTGLQYMLDAQINPTPYIQVLQRMETRDVTSDVTSTINPEPSTKAVDRVVELFSSHPITEKRIAYLAKKTEQLPRDLTFYSLQFDLQRFKDVLQKQLSNQ